MSQRSENGIELTREGAIATITLNRPEARNALTPAGMETLCCGTSAAPRIRVAPPPGHGAIAPGVSKPKG